VADPRNLPLFSKNPFKKPKLAKYLQK